MKGKILLVVGLGIGYVLGTRAGRERYEELKKGFLGFWNSPTVQKQVGNAQDFVKDKAPDVAEFVADGAKQLVSKVAGKPSTPKKATPKAASTK
jgi:hypothetical protein